MGGSGRPPSPPWRLGTPRHSRGAPRIAGGSRRPSPRRVTSMDPTAFLRQVERGQIPPVALVHGADAQLVDDVLVAVGRALFPDPGHAAFDREVLDGRETSVDGVLSASLTLPFGAAARLVVVRHCQALASKGGDALRQYAASPNPTTVLLLLADESL